LEAGRERIRHRAHEIVWARDKCEEAWMIDMKIIRINVALELRENFIWIATFFRRIDIEQWNQFCRIAFRSNTLVAHVSEMLGEKIDNRVAKLPHLVRRQRNPRAI
jgi:hypothetical protein